MYPDIRIDCLSYQLIVEIDEFKHRGSRYSCEEQRMRDIIAKLGQPCVFIRYNPDNKKSNINTLETKMNNYLNDIVEDIQFDDYGLKTEYLFYD